MKNKITGWKNVFSFTLLQTAKSKSFKSTTITLGLIFFIFLFGVNIYGAYSNKADMKQEEPSNSTITNEDSSEKTQFASTVYVNDETGFGLSITDMQNLCNNIYEPITMIAAEQSNEEMISSIKNGEPDSAYLNIALGDMGITIDVYLPTGTYFNEEAAQDFAYCISSYIEMYKDSVLSLSEEQASFLSADIQTSVVSPDDESFVETMVNMYVPMFICLVLYMCIIMYGQMVGTSVATEKSSKVMELILTSVRPLAIIVGKVLSMMLLSLMQLVIFAILGLGGNWFGTILAQKIDPNYSNIVVDVLGQFDLLSMFSPVRIIFALIVFILGFTFYCSLAGLMGATVNRGEDLSAAMSVYSTVSVAGFMLAYLPSILGSVGTGIQTFAAIFPLSSPFILPAKILLGDMSNVTLGIAIGVLLITVIVFMLVVAKVYEMVILYSGNKIGIKQIRQMLKQTDVKA